MINNQKIIRRQRSCQMIGVKGMLILVRLDMPAVLHHVFIKGMVG